MKTTLCLIVIVTTFVAAPPDAEARHPGGHGPDRRCRSYTAQYYAPRVNPTVNVVVNSEAIGPSELLRWQREQNGQFERFHQRLILQQFMREGMHLQSMHLHVIRPVHGPVFINRHRVTAETGPVSASASSRPSFSIF